MRWPSPLLHALCAYLVAALLIPFLGETNDRFYTALSLTCWLTVFGGLGRAFYLAFGPKGNNL